MSEDGQAYDEGILLRRMAGGDEQAFRVVFDRYRGRVWFTAWRLLKSEALAEDATQDAFVKIWAGREGLGEIVQFGAYLNTIVRNQVFNMLRKKANEELYVREQLHLGDKVLDTEDSGFRDLQALLKRAFEKLPPQQKLVFELGRLEGLKHEEIAERLGISRETVKKHMMAASATVKAFLEMHGGYLGLLWLYLTLS